MNNTGIVDYDVNYFTSWIDYTRTFPTGNFNLYARLSAVNGAFNMQCAQVTGGAGTSTQTTNVLGNFVGTGTRPRHPAICALLTTNGVPVVLSLWVGVETLQMADGSPPIARKWANFFVLVPASAPVNTNPATANFTFTVTGGGGGGGGGSQTMNFSWAPDHLGWQLYTNSGWLDGQRQLVPRAGISGGKPVPTSQLIRRRRISSSNCDIPDEQA